MLYGYITMHGQHNIKSTILMHFLVTVSYQSARHFRDCTQQTTHKHRKTFQLAIKHLTASLIVNFRLTYSPLAFSSRCCQHLPHIFPPPATTMKHLS